MDKRIIHSVFENVAMRQPLAIAIEEEQESISYGALNDYANLICAVLEEIRKDETVTIGVILPSGIDLVASILATFKAKLVYVPIDITSPGTRFIDSFQRCASKVVITSGEYKQRVTKRIVDDHLDVQVLVVLHERKGIEVTQTPSGLVYKVINSSEPVTTNPTILPAPDDSNYIFYTSGTNGKPKAILGAHKSLSHFIHWELSTFGFDTTCKVSQLIPYTFDASLRDIFVPLCAGGTLVVPSPATLSSSNHILEWIESRHVSVIHTVPSVFRLLIKELNEKEVPPKFPALKFIFLSGELLYAKDIQEWRKLMGVDIEIVNLYGPTETTMIKTYHRITDVPSDPGQAIHVGQPISNTMVAILNNEKPCNVGEIGEIFIKTPFMSKGYYNQPDLTAEVFVQNPLVKDKTDIIYKTGDLGRFLNDNSIEILGRIDDQVKVNGIRIELNEIRKVILEVNGVTAVEILLTKNNDLNNELVCYYLGPTATEDDVRAGAQRNLIQGMVPSHFVRLEHFPLTHSGKVDRKILAMMRRLTPSDQQGDPPAGQTEELLAQIWKEVLAVERIGRSVSFFQIGGSSLRAIQVISRVYKTFGVRLIIGDIFNNPTLAKLAGKINEGRKEKIQSIISAPCAESYPLSHAQKRLWMLDQYEVNQIAFNINTSYALQGMLDLSAFKKAFELLIQRHESLRTIFVSVDGEPRQKIIPFVDVDLKVEVVDLVGREDKEQRLLLIQEQVFHFAFDLKCLPLFVIKLVKTQEHEHIFLLSIHHIIADGWSMNVFMDDLVVYYNTITLDRPHGLEPLKVQYKDYSTWHNSLLSESMSNNDKMFWQNLLKEFDTSVSLPTDFNRGTLQSFRGNRIFQDVGKEVTKRLKVFSSEQGVTLFHCLLAAVNCVVYGCYGMKDVVIGSPFAGRVLKELENQVGFYVNMLPLRIQLNPEASLLNFVKDVSQMVVKASEHELYPFDRIVSDFGGDTHLQRSSLFDLVVQLQDTQAISKMTDDPNQLTAIELPGKFLTSKFDLTFDFQESKDGIRIEIEYASDLFRLETIKSLSVSLLNVLRKIIDDPNLTLTDLKADLVQLNANPRVKAVEEYINSSLDESF